MHLCTLYISSGGVSVPPLMGLRLAEYLLLGLAVLLSNYSFVLDFLNNNFPKKRFLLRNNSIRSSKDVTIEESIIGQFNIRNALNSIGIAAVNMNFLSLTQQISK